MHYDSEKKNNAIYFTSVEATYDPLKNDFVLVMPILSHDDQQFGIDGETGKYIIAKNIENYLVITGQKYICNNTNQFDEVIILNNDWKYIPSLFPFLPQHPQQTHQPQESRHHLIPPSKRTNLANLLALC
jgi:hypothetical protein